MTVRIRRGSAAAATLGALGGIVLGAVLAGGLANSPCYPDCGGTEAGIFAVMIGIPIAAGYGAWRASSHMAEEIIYRR